MSEVPSPRPPEEIGHGWVRLPPAVVEAMRAELARVAEHTVETVIREVPSYSEPFRGRMGRNIESAVVIALGGFLDLVSDDVDPESTGSRVGTVFDAAYALGRGEARSGRTMDALAAAYRVGVRAAWRDLSEIAVSGGLPAAEIARFAEQVFEYIDQVSSVSVSGHADELATAGRVRERHLERLADGLLEGADEDALARYAERAEWQPPETLTALLVPASVASGIRSRQAPGTLQASSDATDLDEGVTVLLVPDVPGHSRPALLRSLAERGGVIGPVVPWTQARASYVRAARVRELGLAPPDAAVDSGDHLAELVLGADPAALADLRDRVLAPLADLKPASGEKLRATLRSWLLHHGRRDEVAAALYVHPQTVRYRMGQLREIYGERLEDPRFVLEATLALA